MIDRTYRNKDQGRQLVLFDGITCSGEGNKIESAPTDIDGVIEYHDRIRILYEVKHENYNGIVKAGQRLMLRRFVDDFAKAGKPSIAIIATHNVPAPNDIKLADCVVREIYASDDGYWRKPRNRITVGELTKQYIAFEEGMICMH